jgi:hypothetical protein
MMHKLLIIAMTGIFLLGLQGPSRAQKEVAPPPMSPLLEGQRPLEHVEAKESATPKKTQEKKAKVKSGKKYKKAKVKKLAGKKRHTVAKKKNHKAKKKRSAVTPRQAGPDEG